jgi:glutathione S-transferase
LGRSPGSGIATRKRFLLRSSVIKRRLVLFIAVFTGPLQHFTQALRVVSVLDGVLANQKYLVGDKLTIADLVWYPWNRMLDTDVNLLQEASDTLKEEFKSYKNFHRWHKSLEEVSGVKKAYDARSQA